MGRGFVIGSFAPVTLALFDDLKVRASLEFEDVTEARACSGLFVGALLPFSPATFENVSFAASQMGQECEEQFGPSWVERPTHL